MVARYIIRRLAWTVVVLVFITVLTFALFRVIPADPAAFAAGPGATHETVEAARQKLGLDRPLPVQYWQYVTGLIKLDFGTSIITRRPVAEDLKLYLPATFELALISFVLYLFIAISFGVLAAVRLGGLVDSLIRVISMIGNGCPSLLAGYDSATYLLCRVRHATTRRSTWPSRHSTSDGHWLLYDR